MPITAQVCPRHLGAPFQVRLFLFNAY